MFSIVFLVFLKLLLKLTNVVIFNENTQYYELYRRIKSQISNRDAKVAPIWIFAVVFITFLSVRSWNVWISFRNSPVLFLKRILDVEYTTHFYLKTLEDITIEISTAIYIESGKKLNGPMRTRKSAALYRITITHPWSVQWIKLMDTTETDRLVNKTRVVKGYDENRRGENKTNCRTMTLGKFSSASFIMPIRLDSFFSFALKM